MWYVVQVLTGDEQPTVMLVKEQFEKYERDKEIKEPLYDDIFIPLYEMRRKVKGIWRSELKKLFPGYFFIDTENIKEVGEVLLEVAKYTRILRMADEIRPVRPEEEEFLSSLMNRDHIVTCSSGIIVDDRVYITDGVLKDHEARIKKINRHKKSALVEVDLFGRPTEVLIGLEIMIKCSRAEFDKSISESKKEQQIYNEDIDRTDHKSRGKNRDKEQYKKTDKSGRSNNRSSEKNTAADDTPGLVIAEVSHGLFHGLRGRIIDQDHEREKVRLMIHIDGLDLPVEFDTTQIRLIYSES